MKIANLPDRGVIAVAGEDAEKFLQGLVTSDVTAPAIHTALLTPQGKILFDFFLQRSHDGFLLECGRDQIPELVKRLTFYKLRAAVELSDLSEQKAVWAAWDGTVPETESWIAITDPRLPALGQRLISDSGADAAPLGGEVVEPDAYHAHRIALGVPEGGRDFELGDSFPHEANMDQLGGVDFDKGCFIGQEVVSRMQHRGTARKRVVPIEGGEALPPRGSEITADGAPIGQIGSTSGQRGLALIRLDRAERAIADTTPLLAGDVSLRILRPDWAAFEVPTGPSEDAA